MGVAVRPRQIQKVSEQTQTALKPSVFVLGCAWQCHNVKSLAVHWILPPGNCSLSSNAQLLQFLADGFREQLINGTTSSYEDD